MKLWLVWNGEGRNEAVAFDNGIDALQTSTGEFQGMYSTIGEAFFEAYEDNAPLPVEEIEI